MLRKVDIWLASHCPNLLPHQYQIISKETSEYNCIAWAAEENDRWWEPTSSEIYYWPDGVSRELTLAAFIQTYQTLGYQPCDRAEFESGWQKLAIYAKEDGQMDRGQPTHVARQLPNGKWTSKIGELEDIEHDLEGLCGFYYGIVAQILKKALPQEIEKTEPKN